MASNVSSVPTPSDASRGGGMSWRRAVDNRFVWVAPSPSPTEVAELELRYPEVIQVPTQVLMEESSRWEELAVLARSFTRWVQPDAIVREFRRAGVSGDIETISLAHRFYMFRFAHPDAKKLVLGRPWVANGQVIAVEDWRAEFSPSEEAIVSALLWVRLPCLPIEFWSDEILQSILSVAGQFIFSDSFTKEKRRGGFARACVRVDLSKPLRPGARIRGLGSPFWQQFSYEHLEGICVHCGSIHLEGPCSLQPSAGATPVATRFGPWMAALRQRKNSSAQPQELRRKNQATMGRGRTAS